jgi:hypothetical protein
MVSLKLARLPDRTPIKIGIALLPDLHDRLVAYAAVYAEAYGAEESVAELIPAMLAAFLDSDRGFERARKDVVRK